MKALDYSNRIQAASTIERHRKLMLTEEICKSYLGFLGLNPASAFADICGGTGALSRRFLHKTSSTQAIILDKDRMLL